MLVGSSIRGCFGCVGGVVSEIDGWVVPNSELGVSLADNGFGGPERAHAHRFHLGLVGGLVASGYRAYCWM